MVAWRWRRAIPDPTSLLLTGEPVDFIDVKSVNMKAAVKPSKVKKQRALSESDSHHSGFNEDGDCDMFTNESEKIFTGFPANPACLTADPDAVIDNPKVSKMHPNIEKIQLNFFVPNLLARPPSVVNKMVDDVVTRLRNSPDDVSAKYDLGVFHVICHVSEQFNASQDDVKITDLKRVVMIPYRFLRLWLCSVDTPPATIDWAKLMYHQAATVEDASVVLMTQGKMTKKTKNKQEKLLPET